MVYLRYDGGSFCFILGLHFNVISYRQRIGGSNAVQLEQTFEPGVPHLSFTSLYDIPATG
jgi:hypothetical protein